MGRFSGVSSKAAYGKHIFPLMLALLACLIWASAAHAQDAPFDSQYDPPPTTPPECGSGSGGYSSGGAGTSDPGASGESSDPASECAPDAPSDTEAPASVPPPTAAPTEILPTTGGFFLAPIFLGLAAVVGTGIVAVRRKGR